MKPKIQLLIITAFLVVMVSCKSNEDINKNPNDGMVENNLFNQFDASEKNKFGKLNPDAPEQTKQFNFMVGEFNCDDSMLVNGEWVYSKATWNSKYILNGYAVEDTYRNETYAGMSNRYFNTKKNKWDVYFFGMPGEHFGLWEGEKVGDKMIMRQKRKGQGNKDFESILTFYDITDSSFKWKGGIKNIEKDTLIINWKISAKRKK